jgi:hypothetical protein
MLMVTLFGIATRMPGRSHTGQLPPLTDRESELIMHLQAHVSKLAGDIGERNMPRPSALEAAANYIVDSLTARGYQAAVQEFKVGGKTVKNVQAELRGNADPDEFIVVGAHYDSVLGSPGANDNATGVAAVLELARLLASARLDRSIRFVCFANEEPPYFRTEDMGSWHYAKRCQDQNDQVVAMLSIETIGYYRDAKGSQKYPMPFGLLYPDTANFIGFVGNPASKDLLFKCIESFRQHTKFPSEGIAAPAWIEGIDWSDHACFWNREYPAIMITDTAPFRYPYYHSHEDTPDKVDYGRTARVVAGIARVVSDLATAKPH